MWEPILCMHGTSHLHDDDGVLATWGSQDEGGRVHIEAAHHIK